MKQTGEVIYIEDEPFFLRRNGLIEEAYFCLKFFPVIGKDGKVAGYYQAMSESSNRIILDRRVNTFIDVGSCTSAARSLDDFWPSAVAALGKNPKDVPFALIYTIEDSNHPSSISSTCSNISLQTNKTAVLSGALGVPQNHDAAPQRLKLVDSEDGFAPFFRKAMKTPQLTVLHLEDGSLPAHLVANICSPSFGDAVKSVAIAAISPTGSDQILGFFVLGLNPRYPFDQGSANFITAISRLLAAACCSVVLLEEEVNRREEMIEQAANIQADLSKRLSAHQKRLEVQERRFEQIASRAHVGIFAAAPDGQYTYRNQRWFDIFQIAKNEHLIQHAWSMLVEEEDLKACEHAWLNLSQKLVPISFELRLKRTWEAAKDDSDEPIDTNEHKMWILISAYPELADDGSLKGTATF
jgi:PAS domain-containing protein